MSSAAKDMVAKTAALGAQTAKQAEESALAIEQAQRHHEQSLMPIVWLDADCSTGPVKVGDDRAVRFRGAIVNAGPGPATGIYLHIKTSIHNPLHPKYLGFLAASSTRDIELAFLLSSTAQWINDVPYECVARYQTIFETQGAVIQRSHSGRRKDVVVLRYIAPSATSAEEISRYLTENGFPTQLEQ